MKMKMLFMATILVVIGLFSGSRSAYAQDTTPSAYSIFYDTLDSELNVILDYNEFSNSSQTPTLETFQKKVSSWQQKIISAGNVYQKYISDNDSSVKNLASMAVRSNSLGQDAMRNYQLAINTESEDSYLKYLELGDKAMTNYITDRDKVIDYYNEVSGANQNIQTKNIYQWGTVISGIISFLIWLKSRTKSTITADLVRAQIYGSLFASSMWMFIGFLITYIGFSFTSEGGTYYILYGPVIFGGWEFLKGLYTYFTTSRSTLHNLAKTEKYDIYKKSFEGMDRDK
jgi:hypothetical protein